MFMLSLLICHRVCIIKYKKNNRKFKDTGLKEIVNFFNGLQVTQVKLVGGGIAYVQFKNVDLKQEALTYDLRFMSSKFVHGESLG